MSVKFEKIYDNLVKVEWATAIEDGQGGVEENFQLNCLQPCIPHFDVSYTYSFISGKQKFSPDKTVGYLSYNIELCLKQLKHPAQKSLEKSSGEREGNNVNTEVCHRPTAIWASFNGGEKLLLKKSSGLNEWKSQKFPVDVKITREGWLVSKSFKMVVQLWIKFKSMSCGEIQTLNHMSNLFAQQQFCDVQFCFDGNHRIGGHRFILAARSPVFSAMFQHDMQEAKTGRVVIEDIQPDIFKQLLHFIYSGRTKAPLTQASAQSLFVVADKYDIKELKRECALILISYIRIDNVFELLTWAHLYPAEDLGILIEATFAFIAKNAKEICLLDDWAQFMKNHPSLCLLATRRIIA